MFQSGGGINVGFNAPGSPPQPPTVTVTACRFVDNESKMKNGGNAIAFGKGSAKVGTHIDNSKAEISITG